MKKTLQISSLYKQFDTVCAVDMVSFEAKKGEIIALLGPNGAGKTTLMNMIAGFYSPSGGAIKILDFDLSSSPREAKNAIGFLAEGAPMYADMSVKSFLDYIADLKGISSKEKKQRLHDIMEMAQISNVWNMKIEKLSKGYRRRVGFAQSILSNPPILLLDEPTDGLDPNQKEHIRKLIKKLGKDKTILISTHLLDDVEEMCNRILVMNKGKIIADGSKQEIIKKAETTSLADAFKKLTGGCYV